MSNHLAKEKSLYLKQHANNPVDWWPWSHQAFEEAQRLQKPVLISIGYAACHWCHVMAHECFEDPYIADIMNRHFICIKVDREEHPEVDHLYMEAVQMITSRGGWPLNVFCLPDGRPFFGGTYFPPQDRGQGIVPWPQILMRIAQHFQQKPHELEENAHNIVQNLLYANTPTKGDGLSLQVLTLAAEEICKSYDKDWGGFGSAPKFPPSMLLDFLLQIRLTLGQKQHPLAQTIDTVVTKTLQSMAHGGIYDQLRGGFARYSVDRFWLIPHFEKMLYDNALLIIIYTQGFLRYQNPLFQAIVEETIAWLLEDMRLGSHLFAASIDADSEGIEGQYTVWTPHEVKAVLGEEDAKLFCDAYNITLEGNFEHKKSNPSLVYDDFEKRQALQPLVKKLFKARSQRIPPVRDTKAILSWNALLIKGLAEAAFAFGRKDWFKVAHEALEFIWKQCSNAEALQSVYYGEAGRIHANLDDLAFLAEACLSFASKAECYQEGLSAVFISRAQELVHTILKHFRDEEEGGYFFTSSQHDNLVMRKKMWWDNAQPSGNASMVHVLSTLFALTGDSRYQEDLVHMQQVYSGLVKRAPAGIPHALSGFVGDSIGLVQIKFKDPKEIPLLQEKLSKLPWQKIFILPAYQEQTQRFQLCMGTRCLPPVDSLEELFAHYLR